MQFLSFIVVIAVVSLDVSGERRSDNRRVMTREAPQWTIISDVATDGSIVFPTRKPGSRPFPRPQPPVSRLQEPSTTTTTAAPLEPKDQQLNDDVQIPVSLFLNKSFNSLEDFMKNLVLQNEYRAAGFVAPSASAAGEAAVNFLRSNSAGPPSYFNMLARSGGLAIPANCEPQDTTVELERPEDPSLIYFPRCTKVQRCGGCCQHDLLACVPTSTEAISVNVMKARFVPESNSFQPEGLHPIALEKHTACECQCRVKAEDCNPMQQYRSEECRCICTNEHESKDCIGSNKFWDPQTCRCECRNNPDCSTGFFFDEHTCTCQPSRSNGIVFPSRRSGLNTRGGHVPYELDDDGGEVVEFIGARDDTTSYSPWYIRNVMRTNVQKPQESSRK